MSINYDIGVLADIVHLRRNRLADMANRVAVIETLKRLGLNYSALYIECRSEEDYLKMLEIVQNYMDKEVSFTRGYRGHI